MRIQTILHYLGLLIAVLGLFMLVPLIASLIYGDTDSLAFATASAVSLVFGLFLWRLTGKTQRRLSQREAIVLVVGGYITAFVFGSLPYVLSDIFPSYLDALFESVSGLTTTGATVLTSIDSQGHGILLWRSLTQWLGGLGIITLFVALFPVLGIGASRLVEAETPGHQGERLTARIRDTAKALWLLYIGLTGLEFVLLLIARLPAFDALSVTLTTIPIGGFTPTDASIGAYNSMFVEGIIMFFMVAAGVNFGLYYFLLWKRQPGRLLKNPEFRAYLLILIGAVILVNWDLVVNMGLSIGDAMRFGTFNTLSIGTTTGYSTTDFNTWPTLARSVLLVLMVVGASAGSTGGALKVIRFLVLAKYTFRRFFQTFNPHVVVPLKVGGAVISGRVTSRIISMALLYMGILVAGFLIMSALGLDLPTALSSVTASLGNVGPGLGAVGPAETYAGIPALGKGVLMVLMLAGRLELFTLFVLLVPAFWRWR
ncbi:MAG: TrkH family potassium uptake protein [Dehalococcoidales bacterium]